MGDEHDSWFKPFGFDPAKLADDVLEKGKAVVVQTIQQGVNQAKAFVEDKIDKGVKAIAGAVTPSGASPKTASAAGAVSSPSSLGGSVGRGGQNNPSDVKGIQRALGISDDGKCGPATIKAIENFQRSLGQAKPDGRIDPGGPTSRALAGGAGSAAAPAIPGVFDGAVDKAEAFAGKIQADAGALLQSAESEVQSTLQSAQDSVLEELGVSPETAQKIRAAEQAIADFDRGRKAGRASGSVALIEMLPQVQLAKAAKRIAEADDPEAEAQKIAEEKRNTLAAIGKFGTDPAGSGAAIGESLGKSAVKAKQEGRTAEFIGNLVGQGDVVAATIAVGGAGAGLEAGGAEAAAAGVEAGGARGLGVGVEAGGARALGAGGARGVGAGVEVGGARGVGAGVEVGGARGAAAGAEEAGVVVRTAEGVDAAAPTSRAPKFGEPVPPEGQVKGPPTEVDPPKPPQPKSPKPNAPRTLAEARQNVIDAAAEQEVTAKASQEATEEFVRFQANKPNPARGVKGDPSKFDPVVSEALEDQMLRAQQANEEAITRLKDAQQAAKAAQDAAARAKGARGGGGFPPPRKK